MLNEAQNNDVSVLIYSCDAYSDVWGAFFTLLFRYWQCPYQVYLATESEQCLLPEVKTINTQGDTWTERIHDAVAQIPTKYVIAMCEDCFIRKNVRQNIIDGCIRSMEQDGNIACFNFEKEYKEAGPTYIENFGRKPNGSEFRQSCQPTLWRKSILLELLDYKMDPWEWEDSPAPDKYNYFVWTGADDELVFEYGYHNYQWFGIQKGKWVEADIRQLFEREDINIDLSIRGTI